MLDTHKIVKRLEGSGFTAAQAETITDVMVENQQEGFSSLATKTDLRETEMRLDEKLTAVRGEIKGLKAEMLQWFIGALVAFAGVIIAAFKMFSGH